MQGNSLHRKRFYTQTLLHTKAFTHRSFYTDAFTHKAFTHRSFYIQKLLHAEAFTHRHLYTQTLLHTNIFAHRRFYTQALLDTSTCTHRGFYALTAKLSLSWPPQQSDGVVRRSSIHKYVMRAMCFGAPEPRWLAISPRRSINGRTWQAATWLRYTQYPIVLQYDISWFFLGLEF